MDLVLTDGDIFSFLYNVFFFSSFVCVVGVYLCIYVLGGHNCILSVQKILYISIYPLYYIYYLQMSLRRAKVLPSDSAASYIK